MFRVHARLFAWEAKDCSLFTKPSFYTSLRASRAPPRPGLTGRASASMDPSRRSDRHFRYVRYIAPNAVNAAMQATATHGSARRDLSLRVWLEPARATAPALHSSSEPLPHVLRLQELDGSFALHRHGLHPEDIDHRHGEGWMGGRSGRSHGFGSRCGDA